MSYTLAIWNRLEECKTSLFQQYEKITNSSRNSFQVGMMSDFLELSKLASNSQFELLDNNSLLVNIPSLDMLKIESIIQFCIENNLVCYDPQLDEDLSKSQLCDN